MAKSPIKLITYGDVKRLSYAKKESVLEMPDLLDVQKDSYNWFITEGLQEVLDDVSPIADYNNNLILEFLGFDLDMDNLKYTEEECKDRDATYSASLKLKVKLSNKEIGEFYEQDVFVGPVPIMTERGSFVINGAERVIVSQLVRSPGVYFDMKQDNKGKPNGSCQIIPNRGAWLEYECDSKDVFWVRVDRTRKLPVTGLIRSLFGLPMVWGEEKLEKDELEAKNKQEAMEKICHVSSLDLVDLDEEMIDYFNNDIKIAASLEKDPSTLAEEAKEEYISARRAELEAKFEKRLQAFSKTYDFKDDEIDDMKDEFENKLNNLKAGTKQFESAIIEIYKKLRPGEPPTIDSARSLFENMMFDDKRYDLSKVGRYKFDKKLSLGNRAIGKTLSRPAVNVETGEILYDEGTKITKEIAEEIQDAGINIIYVNHDGKEYKVISNSTVDIDKYLEKKIAADCNIKERVYLPVLQELWEDAKHSPTELKKRLKDKKTLRRLVPKNITIDDILASINYQLTLDNCVNGLTGVGNVDDIDHLGNRRIKCVGELLQNQFRIGLTRMEKVIRERMNIQNTEMITPQALMNTRPVISAIREFFGTSQLSQFMQQDNPLDELTHKRKLSALGPGGLSRERAGFEVRDIHYSHYGRMCPIETPEGPNIGLINSLAGYARVNEYGFIETPYRIVDHSKKRPVVTDECKYFTADEEELYNVAQCSEPLDEQGHFINSKVIGRHLDDIDEFDPEDIGLMDISPLQMVSVATASIPFLENDDCIRALMGSNMQRQSVPLLKPASAVVATGMEWKTAINSGAVVLAKHDGVVKKVEADKIIIETKKGDRDEYKLRKYKRSNSATCINQRPIVNNGQKVKAGEVIADGPSTRRGEMALGKNPLVAFMTWEGYNYEDAVLISERLVQDDVFTSIHIEEYEMQTRTTKLGDEEITRDIPNIGEDAIKDIEENGIVRIGAKVGPGDILVGRVTPKGETELSAEERLLRAIFGEKSREVRDTSLRMPHGSNGIVLDVKRFTRKNCDELPAGVNEVVRVYVAEKRKIQVGDKMAGRHGNKGVVSRVLPVEEMPYLPNGRPVDIVLNPLGVPSRMNLGQILEVHLGLAAEVLGVKVATPVLNGANENDVKYTLRLANDFVNTDWDKFEKKWKKELDPEVWELIESKKDHRSEWAGVPINEDGKIRLRDGRTGEFFDSPVTVGFMNYLKLHHLVDDKIHARSTGPYSLVTQQPLGGKAQFGGQRFGEMEVWALESYGAAYTLREVLTVKSDDVIGRVKTYEAIVKGQPIPKAGVPESFKVFIKELQALGLDVLVQNAGSDVEIQVDEGFGDDTPADSIESDDSVGDFEVTYVENEGGDTDIDGGFDGNDYGD